jgi:hypothetical protein
MSIGGLETYVRLLMLNAVPNFYSFSIALDSAIAFLLLVFIGRSLRLPHTLRHSKRLTELEVSLRTLVREATVSGSNLNDELRKRRGELEKSLQEIERAYLKAQATIIDLNSATNKAVLPTKVEKQEVEASKGEQAPSLKSRVRFCAQKPHEIVKAQQKSQKNIFSLDSKNEFLSEDEIPRVTFDTKEKILTKKNNSKAVVNHTSLDSLVEKETTRERKSNMMLEVYEAAERLIKSGQNLDNVAQVTKLPLSEVKLLSEIVARENVVKGARKSRLSK